MRKSPNSLGNISEAKVIDWLLRLIDKSPSNFWRNVVKNRKYLRRNLPAHLRSMLLDKVKGTSLKQFIIIFTYVKKYRKYFYFSVF